jgi:hypothetical protein
MSFDLPSGVRSTSKATGTSVVFWFAGVGDRVMTTRGGVLQFSASVVLSRPALGLWGWGLGVGLWGEG